MRTPHFFGSVVVAVAMTATSATAGAIGEFVRASQWSENGNWYSVFRIDEGVSWLEARDAAESLGGHLVTITSEAENDFAFNLVNDASLWNFNIRGWGPWIGLYQEGVSNGTEAWVTGEAVDFTNWETENTTEPSSSGERATHFFNFNPTGPNNVWNDWEDDVASSSRIIAYVVESTFFIPAPSSAGVLAIAGVLAARRRRRG